MKLTTKNRYIKVYRDDVEISQHIEEKEAIESAYNTKKANPNSRVHYARPGWEVEIELDEATPIPSPSNSTLKWYETPLSNNSTIHPNSNVLVSALIRQAKKVGNGDGRAVYDSQFALDGSAVPIFEVDGGVEEYISLHPGSFVLGFHSVKPSFASVNSDQHAVIRDKSRMKHTEYWKLIDPSLRYGGQRESYDVWDGRWPYPQGARACGVRLDLGVYTIDALERGTLGTIVVGANMICNKTPVFPANRTDGYSVDGEFLSTGQTFRFPQDWQPPSFWPSGLKTWGRDVRNFGWFIGDSTMRNNVNWGYIEDPRVHGKDLAWVRDTYFGSLPGWKLGQLILAEADKLVALV